MGKNKNYVEPLVELIQMESTSTVLEGSGVDTDNNNYNQQDWDWNN